MLPSCARRQAGFTLIELLVVVAIISILASIAIPVFARYKQQAVDSDMMASLHSARTAMEAYYVDAHSYLGVTEPVLRNYGYQPSATVTLSPPVTTVNNYIVSVCAPGGTSAAFTYDSNGGTFIGGACP